MSHAFRLLALPGSHLLVVAALLICGKTDASRVGIHMSDTKIPLKVYGLESNVQACPFLFNDVFDIRCHLHRCLYFIMLSQNWMKASCTGEPYG